MNLIKETIKLPVQYSINGDAEDKRNELALAAIEVKAITCAKENEQAAVAVRSIRDYLKSVEATRQLLTKPLLDAQRLIKSLADDHCAPLLAEQQRIERLAIAFSQAEARRVVEEERKRQEAFLKAEAVRMEAERKAEEARQAALKKNATAKDVRTADKLEAKAIVAEEKVQAVIAAPPPEVARSKGQQTKKVLRFEVTDLAALVKARPDLCKIEAKPSAINSVCTPEMPNPPPWLKL